MLTVACVLKSGREYTPEYVRALKAGIEKNLSVSHRFVCLSDVPVVNRIKLEHTNWNRWWPKIELFKLTSPVLYFDLDVFIAGNIDPVAEYVITMRQDELLCFKPIKFHDCNQVQSSILGWNADFSFIYNAFALKFEKNRSRYGGDQRYIWASIRKRNIRPVYIRTIVDGVYFYWIDCREMQEKPDDARIVICCGHPRPPECPNSWIKDHYRPYFSCLK